MEGTPEVGRPACRCQAAKAVARVLGSMQAASRGARGRCHFGPEASGATPGGSTARWRTLPRFRVHRGQPAPLHCRRPPRRRIPGALGSTTAADGTGCGSCGGLGPL
ncbi:unnamed protein product [Symbiodinium sp. CCMP2592]|nr:unnamed protein product [Symbiodinium sp. CCMP2592]